MPKKHNNRINEWYTERGRENDSKVVGDDERVGRGYGVKNVSKKYEVPDHEHRIHVWFMLKCTW